MRKMLAGLLLVLMAGCGSASAQDKLRVAIWGGEWRDLIDNLVSKKFTAQTGIPVEYVTGGNNDRLTKAKLAGANPESDVSFTTSHWGWLYNTGNLFETLDLSLIPNAADVFAEGKSNPTYIGTWSYVYSIGYRPEAVPEDIKFSTWKDLWDPRLKGKIGLHATDPSHFIIATTKLAGTDIAHWEKAQPLLKSIKPSVKAYYSSDAEAWEKIASGETPILVMISSNGNVVGRRINFKYVIPKEGGVASIDVVGINKGTKMREAAHKFINIVLDPEVQGAIAVKEVVGPMNSKAKLPAETAALPGVFVTPQQWKEQAIVVDDKTRAEKLSVWRDWVAENMH